MDDELRFYIIAGIVLLLFAVGVNIYLNKVKTSDCIKRGGTVVLNTSNANQTVCIINPQEH